MNSFEINDIKWDKLTSFYIEIDGQRWYLMPVSRSEEFFGIEEHKQLVFNPDTEEKKWVVFS